MSLVPSSPPINPTGQPQDLAHAHPPVGTGMPAAPTLDLWGALARRKFIVFLACLVAGGLGYLDYKRQPQKFASSTRLMITTQLPPRLVNGDFVNQRPESMSRHNNLLTSQLVLGSAIEAGELTKLDSFKDNPYPVGRLSQMLSVSSLSQNDDTLTIRCEGPDPDDLPIILNQVVHAFTNIIAEDSETIGKDSIELIEKLKGQLTEDKNRAERRYLELLKARGLSAVSYEGQIENPFVVRAKDLSARSSELSEKLQQASYRASSLNAAINSDNEQQLKIAAIEAKTYLGLDRHSNALAHSEHTDRQIDGNLLQMITAAENRIAELSFEKSKLSKVFGRGHRTISNIDEQIDYWKRHVAKQKAQLNEMELEAGAEENAKIDMNEIRRREDAEWILLYKMSLNREINRLNFEHTAVNTELADMEQKAANIAQDVVELNLLRKQIEEKREANRVIVDRLSEIDILSSNYTTTKVRVLDPPVSGYKIAPVLSKSLGYALFLGSLIGMGLALLIDRSDLSFRSPFEIFERLKIPVVGKIPRIRSLRKNKSTTGMPQLIVANRPGSSVSEAFRDIRTAMFFRASSEQIKTILFTSPSPGDGKTTTVSNLAISIAQTGKSVVLVDADFRRPRVNTYFGEELKPGLLDVIEGRKSVKDAIVETKIQSGLFMMAAGGRPKSPGEIVTSIEFRNVIETLRESFDFVLIDSPPVLPVADPASIAGIVDGVYMVVRIRKGVKVTAQKAKDSLDRINPNWMGIIVNGLDENPHYSEYSNYPYYVGYHGRYYEMQNAEYRDKGREKE